MTHEHHAPHAHGKTVGRVLHSALGYDLVAWLFLRGRERAFRRTILERAGVRPGHAVLDVGCGTGTLAIAAKELTGATGAVHGIDPSPEMIARATSKARRAGLDVTFQNATAQALPFLDGAFDVVLSTLMMHHLPRDARAPSARELRRVTKSGGRVVVVDFVAPTRRGLLRRVHRHGHVNVEAIIGALTEAGLVVEESGPLGVLDLQIVVARAP